MLWLALSTTALLSVTAWACAGFPSPLPFLRKTFLPLTKAEFWFPPCPICWAARVALLIVLALPFLNAA